MKKNNVILIIIISVIAILIAGYTTPAIIGMPLQGTEVMSPPSPPGEQEKPQSLQPPIEKENIYLKTLVSFINLGLILPLFVIYAGIYREIKSSFTLGLMAVIFALGMYAVTSNPLIIATFGGFPGHIGIFQIIPDLCTTAALLILIKISLQ